MTQDENGNLVRSVGQVAVGEKLTVSLADGTIHATIAEIKENCHESGK
jgi:exonuclease VII large subunit